MNRIRVFPIIVAFMFAAAAQAGNSPVAARTKLEAILSCQRNAAPKEVASLIKTLGGRAIVHTSPTFDAQYTIPDPVEIFGRPVTNISIHRGMKPGGAFTEYGALFSGESIATVARIAGIIPDAAGTYRKTMGRHDLILRPEAGITYMTCVKNVRTIKESIRFSAENSNKSIAASLQKG